MKIKVIILLSVFLHYQIPNLPSINRTLPDCNIDLQINIEEIKESGIFLMPVLRITSKQC